VSETAVRLRRLGRPHARARAGAALLASAGVAFGAAAAGIALAPAAVGVLAAWFVIGAACALGAWVAGRAARGVAAPVLARAAERAVGARPGSVGGLVVPVAAGGASAGLLELADRRAAAVVTQAAPAVARALGRATRRAVAAGVAAAAAGGGLFAAAAPAGGGARATAFWHPLRTLAAARAPVRLVVDRTVARRGDTVTVTITVPAASRAVLWTRRPGEAWQAAPLRLDSLGRAIRRLGPLTADLYLRATSGARASPERRVRLAPPVFVASLEITARYPGYLGRPDEPLLAGPDTSFVPEGTLIATAGTASVALAGAAWRRGRSAAPLAVHGVRFSGVAPAAPGTWRLELAPLGGAGLEGPVPELTLRVVPDSAPVVNIPVPGRDTALPLSLVQPLVIDARDDHGLARIEIVSWRASQTGKVGAPVRDVVAVAGMGERAIVPAQLDARSRGLLPGDTLRVQVVAWDNAPRPHAGRSAVLALRLPSLEELRAGARAAARDAAAVADSLVRAQQALARQSGDLAEQRIRDSTGERPARSPAGAGGPLPFDAAERAKAVAAAQQALADRVRALTESVAQLARAAEAAGLADTAFQARLREVQAFLRRAVTPELEERLRELQAALAKLDPEAMRAALERLAEAQQRLKAELERSRELFRRAAVEGALVSLAADADELRRRQREWTGAEAPRADSAAAARERALAARADSLARGIAEAAADLAAANGARVLAAPLRAAGDARAAMLEAARAAAARQAGGAQEAGGAAARALDAIPERLRAARDSLAQAWRGETLAALDQALVETAGLAEREQRVVEALGRGDAGARTRAAQASVEEGSEAVARQIRDAAGRHALVSPALEAALGYAQRQMAEVRAQLEEANGNAAEAVARAEEAVDALNAAGLALAATRDRVAGAQSGTGFAEAVEQLARLARDQEALAGAARGLLPLLDPSGAAVLEELRTLAARQRAVAERLERLRAEGASAAAGALAREARELARQLEAGQLDPQVIARQERLYRRLLDAGRTLRSDVPDERQERVSRAASGDSVHVPPALVAPVGAGPRLRYPTWAELQRLSPDDRRLVLEYFRRLNAPATP
jgi:hypothetical protein